MSVHHSELLKKKSISERITYFVRNASNVIEELPTNEKNKVLSFIKTNPPKMGAPSKGSPGGSRRVTKLVGKDDTLGGIVQQMLLGANRSEMEEIITSLQKSGLMN
jgi:hypothetical protein